MNRSAPSLRTLTITTVMALLLTTIALLSPAQSAAQDGITRGPDPTADALRIAGPFTVVTVEVADSATPGFGAATIFHPADVSQTYAGVVALPGFTATRSSMAWIAERLASHGFVVLTANTNGSLDFPESRGAQMLAAIDYLRDDSAVASQVDGTRIGVMGHSMGGGGSLEAISADPTIDAAVPFTPWNTDKTWGEVTTPTLIVGAENDTVASTAGHAIPFYESYAADTERAYLELTGAGHSVPTGPDDDISLYTVSWMKRYLDADLRYTPFICPGPDAAAETSLSDYRSSCDPTGISPPVADTSVRPTVTCLAGNGRIDLNIVNGDSVAHTYTITVGALSPRTNTVAALDWWRSPVTGRPDGPISATVEEDGVVIFNEQLEVLCDAAPAVSTPEIDLISVCRGGLGFVAWQFANPTASSRVYLIEFEGVANRSTTAAAHGASVRGVSGRPDGTYDYTVRADGAVASQGTVMVTCN